MSEAFEDPRHRFLLKLSTHSVSYSVWNSTMNDFFFQVQEAFQYSQGLYGSTGALRGPHLTFLSQSPEPCDLIFWAVPG